MRYETLTSIKGWVGLIVTGIGSLSCLAAYGAGHTLRECAVATFILFLGLGLGTSWMRGRKHIRESQMVRKALHRMLQEGNVISEPPRRTDGYSRSPGYKTSMTARF